VLIFSSSADFQHIFSYPFDLKQIKKKLYARKVAKNNLNVLIFSTFFQKLMTRIAVNLYFFFINQ